VTRTACCLPIRLFAIGFALRRLSGVRGHPVAAGSPARTLREAQQERDRLNAVLGQIHKMEACLQLQVLMHDLPHQQRCQELVDEIRNEVKATGLLIRKSVVLAMRALLAEPLEDLLSPAGPPDVDEDQGRAMVLGYFEGRHSSLSASSSSSSSSPTVAEHVPDSSAADGGSNTEAEALLLDGMRVAGRTDVEDLLLSGPVPVEALLPPELWWDHQRSLLDLDCCEECLEEIEEGKVRHACCACLQRLS